MTRTICLAVWYVCAKPCVVEVEPAKLRVPCITAACNMRCHNEHSLGRACTNPPDYRAWLSSAHTSHLASLLLAACSGQ